MTQPFEPKNALEEKLLAAQQGLLPGDAFMHELLQAQLFMPILDRHSISGFQDSKDATPLTLTAEDGTEVLVLFTSPERGKAFLQQYPGYEGGLLAEFTWILERIGTGLGITINPDSDAGIDMEPDMVRQLSSAHD